MAVRPGFANEFQLDDFLEKTLPDVLERTFDENGIKMLPLPEMIMVQHEEKKEKEVVEESSEKTTLASKDDAKEDEKEKVPTAKETIAASTAATTVTAQEVVEKVVLEGQQDQEELIECNDPEECWERVEQMIWENRTVVPAMDGILLPARSYGSP